MVHLDLWKCLLKKKSFEAGFEFSFVAHVVQETLLAFVHVYNGEIRVAFPLVALDHCRPHLAPCLCPLFERNLTSQTGPGPWQRNCPALATALLVFTF